MMKRRSKRICPTRGDRFFWIVFVRFIEGWRKLLVALHPDLRLTRLVKHSDFPFDSSML